MYHDWLWWTNMWEGQHYLLLSSYCSVLTFGNGLLRKTLPPMEWAQRKHHLFIQEVHRCPYFWKDGKPWILECGHVGNLGPWDFLNWSLLPSRCTLAATVQLCCVFFFWEFWTKYLAHNLDNFAPSKKRLNTIGLLLGTFCKPWFP